MSHAQPVFNIVVLNIVVTGRVFWHLRLFVCSQVHNIDTRFRLVANRGEVETPSCVVYHGMAPRLAVARYTAAVRRGLVEQTPRPTARPRSGAGAALPVRPRRDRRPRRAVPVLHGLVGGSRGLMAESPQGVRPRASSPPDSLAVARSAGHEVPS
jgi:hypothetical protein